MIRVTVDWGFIDTFTEALTGYTPERRLIHNQVRGIVSLYVWSWDRDSNGDMFEIAKVLQYVEY